MLFRSGGDGYDDTDGFGGVGLGVRASASEQGGADDNLRVPDKMPFVLSTGRSASEVAGRTVHQRYAGHFVKHPHLYFVACQ